MDTSEITYYVDPPVFEGDCLVAVIPAGLHAKLKLLDALAKGLEFPSYFGRNWDAFNDCINDLRWLQGSRVVVLHEDLPLTNDRNGLATYLNILLDAADSWTKHPRVIDGHNEFLPNPREHQISVLFKQDYKGIIQGLQGERFKLND